LENITFGFKPPSEVVKPSLYLFGKSSFEEPKLPDIKKQASAAPIKFNLGSIDFEKSKVE
jgi:hypothetical protein